MDLIERQKVIDAVLSTEPVVFDAKHLEPYQKTTDVIKTIEALPSTQPTQTNTPNALKALDCVGRQDAIDKVDRIVEVNHLNPDMVWFTPNGVKTLMEELPSAQPEIIRCKDCKYSDENWRRVSVKWLPCMDMRTGSNWFCGSAERRTDD